MTIAFSDETPLRAPDDDGLAGMLRRIRIDERKPSEASVPAEAAPPAPAPPLDPVIIQAVRDFVQATLSRQPDLRWLVNPFSPAEARYDQFVRLLRDEIGRQRVAGGPLATVSLDWSVLVDLYAEAIGWGPAQPFLDDPNVNEVKLIGDQIVVQERGRPPVIAAARFLSVDDVVRRIRVVAALAGVALDARTPQLTIPVPGGTRVHASIPPLVDNSVLVVIRRGREHAWTLDDLLARRSISPAVADVLQFLTLGRCSFLVAGTTGSGKTTVLEALANTWSSYAGSASPHIVSVEDYARELVISNGYCWTPIRTNTPEEYDHVLQEALRQTPSLLIAGEIRNHAAASVIDVILTGHPGMTTIHADHPVTALIRLATLASHPSSLKYANRFGDALRDAVEGFDVVIVVRRDEMTGFRYVHGVYLVEGIEETLGNTVRPRVRPLVEAVMQPDRSVTWQVYLSITNGRPVMLDGSPVPERLLRILPRIEGASRQQAAQLAREGVQRVVEQAQALMSSQPDTAMDLLQQAWREFAHPDIVRVARTILQNHLDRFRETLLTAQQAIGQIRRYIETCQWEHARDTYQRAIYPSLVAIVQAPPLGKTWQETVDRIRTGMAVVDAARRNIRAATALVQEGNLIGAQQLIEGIEESHLPIDLRLALVDARILILERQHADAAADAARHYRRQLEERQRAEQAS